MPLPSIDRQICATPALEPTLNTAIRHEPQDIGDGVAALPEAVLFDMDGTLVDTEPYWMAAEHEIIGARGGTWSHEQGLKLVGNDLITSAKIILDETGIAGEPEELVDALLAGVVERLGRDGVPWRPGAQELLEKLRDAGVPCALVTMSYTSFSSAVVAAAPDGVFQAVVSGDDVTHGKPHPEPYLTAAQRLNIDITRSVAIEDSPVGTTSALASGARTVVVPLLVDVAARENLTRLRTLEGVDLELLGRIAAGEVVDELAADAEPAR